MPNHQTTNTVLQLVSHLRGPECTAEELSWALDIPAGKELLDWLANQVPDHAVPGVRQDIEPAVSPIVLYPEERISLASLQDSGPEQQPGPRQQAGTSYELPSRLRSRISAIEDDAELLEKHAARLKHRLSASKKSAKTLKQVIHTLRKQVQSIDETIQHQEVRLADLSAEADGAVARLTSLALRSLEDSSSPAGTNGDDPIDAHKAEISKISGSRTAVSTATKQLCQHLDEGYASLLGVTELQHDAEAVQTKLRRSAKDRNVMRKAVDVAYVEELEKMTKMIEAAPNTEVIAQILEAAPADSTIKPGLEVDVKAELELAGRLDRLTLLSAQEKGLDTITSYMREEVIPQLQSTYDTLYGKSTIAIETEALISALIEELEDVNDAAESTRRPADMQRCDAEVNEDLLEAHIIELLKTVLSSETDKPVVLLNRSDVESEISSLTQRLSVARKAEEAWATGLPSRVGELSSVIASLLATTYANSPVNTSPPFVPGAAQVALQEDTRTKAETLMSAAARLQKEMELSSRDKRKLGAFVEKWVATTAS